MTNEPRQDADRSALEEARQQTESDNIVIDEMGGYFLQDAESFEDILTAAVHQSVYGF